jgi:hypothetical protein
LGELSTLDKVGVDQIVITSGCMRCRYWVAACNPGGDKSVDKKKARTMAGQCNGERVNGLSGSPTRYRATCH